MPIKRRVSGRKWYLPHHTIYQDAQRAQKCYMMFNGSTRVNRLLKSCLNLYSDLLNIIQHFCQFCAVLQADFTHTSNGASTAPRAVNELYQNNCDADQDMRALVAELHKLMEY
ncbi:hypothetical protein T06_10768 [Trichinella sp. T6]|nr:hypothetical protein T06_10768 [Trichinella sp. T6]